MEYTTRPLTDLVQRIKANGTLTERIDQTLLERLCIAGRRMDENRWTRPFRVVFCGVFSSGKTSLINALLNCSREMQLPTGINPITKLVTRIRYGSEFRCTYQNKGKIQVLDRDQAIAVIQGKDLVQPDRCEISIEMPSDLLKSGMEIIDTPGFDDEMGGELEQMSRNAIAEADMAVLCCSALQLGKITERALLQELNARLGHFSLVISRMDNLNTEEDHRDVLKKAHWLMEEMAGSMGAFEGIGERIFPLCISESYQDIEAFRRYLARIRDDAKIQRAIMVETDRRRGKQSLDELENLLDMVSNQLQQEFDDYQKKNDAIIQKKTLEAEQNRAKRMNRAEQARQTARTFILERLNQIQNGIQSLDKPLSFQNDANRIMENAMETLFAEIANYGGKEGMGDPGEILSLLRSDYRQHNFSVPKPTSRFVTKRGLLGRTLFTVFNVLDGDISIDDGRELEWEDFHTPTIRAIQEGPMLWVAQRWVAYLERWCEEIKLSGFTGGYESELDRRRSELTTLFELRRILPMVRLSMVAAHARLRSRRVAFIGGENVNPNIIACRLMNIQGMKKLSIGGMIENYDLTFRRGERNSVMTPDRRVDFEELENLNRFLASHQSKDLMNRCDFEISAPMLCDDVQVATALLDNQGAQWDYRIMDAMDADVIVIVTSKGPPTHENEQALIDLCMRWGVKELFFIVNTRGLSLGGRLALPGKVKKALMQLMTKENGKFDKMRYRQRVLFINPEKTQSAGDKEEAFGKELWSALGNPPALQTQP